MKFFKKEKSILEKSIRTPEKIYFYVNTFSENFKKNKVNFVNFFLKKGLKKKYNYMYIYIIKNFNNFFLKSYKTFSEKNIKMRQLFKEISEKKTIYDIIIEHTLKLIESPFIIKAITTSKKIKKKLKKKFLMKITYLKENKRLQNSFKQLYFYNLAFFENNFKIRLLKSIITTFLE